MNEDQALELAHAAIFTLLTVATPVMLVGLVVGLAIAVFQALTQIQEITLTFVPKIIVVFISLLAFLPFMLDQMTQLMLLLADKIAGLG